MKSIFEPHEVDLGYSVLLTWLQKWRCMDDTMLDDCHSRQAQEVVLKTNHRAYKVRSREVCLSLTSSRMGVVTMFSLPTPCSRVDAI